MHGTDGQTTVKKSNCKTKKDEVRECISVLKGHDNTFEYETKHNCYDPGGSGCRSGVEPDDIWEEIWNHDGKSSYKCGKVKSREYITWRSYKDCAFACGGGCTWTEQYERAYDNAGNLSNEVHIYTTIEY